MKTPFVLTPLGSMGWIPVRSRHTCCYALEMEDSDTLVVFDAGTGLARFEEPWGRAILDRFQTVLLLLSHYHLDHVSGLIYLPYFFKHKKVHLAAPGQELYDRSAFDILADFIRPPYFGRALDQLTLDLDIHDLGVGSLEIGGVTVETIRQEHSDPTVGIKIDGSVCYITDTPCSEAAVSFASGARLLLHETWLDSADHERLQAESHSSPGALKILQSHSSVRPVAEIARKAGVGDLLLIHFNPAYDEQRLKAMEAEARTIFSRARLARDGMPVRV
jgi:ribonuclease BN (tRNA processing enzyme)